ncbi:rhsB element core protein RshB, partial [Escherichia coli O104:H4 str. E92/11]
IYHSGSDWTEGGMEPVWISIESDIRHRPPGFIYVGGCKIGGMY